MKDFLLSVAEGTRQKSSNKFYSLQATISTIEELTQAVQYDHVAGCFKDNHRLRENFLNADCIIMDCDNGHSETESEWLTPDMLAARLPGVEFAIVYSRSHMRDKKGSKDEGTHGPRPRWHVYFTLSEPIHKADRIDELKDLLLVLVPEFDAGAKGAARLFYGVEHPQVELHEGSMCVDEFIMIAGIELSDAGTESNTAGQKHIEATQQESIEEGKRNSTLFHVALDGLIKYTEAKARQLFDKACTQCNPPLPMRECTKIWESALKRRNAFREKFTEKKKTLTLSMIEQTLQALNISVRFDVIRKELEVSDMPTDSAHVPEAYYSMELCAKKNANAKLLPLFLISYFKDKMFSFSESFLTGSIEVLAETHRYNPVLDLIMNTRWDGQDRISKLCQVLGIQNNEYQCRFLHKWLHQAIALAGNDDGAVSPEFVLVLQGAQGTGKTSFFKKLAMRPEWFGEGCVIDMRNKDSQIESTAVWLAELGELDSTLKREQASLKSFLTSNFDTYRRPYARKAEKVERRTVFAATVNPEAVNRDTTGSRRFIYIHVEAIDKQFILQRMTPDWCAQLWRQVYDTMFLTHGRFGFYLTADERAYAEKSNEAFNVPMTAETELLDMIDFEECFNIDPADGTPCKVFQWYTATEIKDRLKLIRYSSEQIGSALKALCERYPHTSRKRSHGRTLYLLPPVQDLRDD